MSRTTGSAVHYKGWIRSPLQGLDREAPGAPTGCLPLYGSQRTVTAAVVAEPFVQPYRLAVTFAVIL